MFFVLKNKTREAFQAIPSFIPQRAAPVFTNVTETRIVHDNEEMKRLEGIIAEMRNEIALLKKSCCKEIDLSPYALRSDLEKVKFISFSFFYFWSEFFKYNFKKMFYRWSHCTNKK